MYKWLVKKLKEDRKGFTLIELVVVIAILGILAAIAVPKLSKSRLNAAISAHNANVRTLESAATMAIADGLTFSKVGEDEDDEVTWGEKEDDDGKRTWEDYLQAWPEIPSGLSGKPTEYEYADEAGDADDWTSYKVTITEGGKITVTPGRLVKTEKNDD